MNVELLQEVATKLRRMRHKAHFNMDDFIKQNECGTAACIGGHGLLMKGYKTVMTFNGRAEIVKAANGRSMHPWDAARKLFELTPRQAEKLFLSTHWPVRFDDDNPKSAADRIDHFIATKGKE